MIQPNVGLCLDAFHIFCSINIAAHTTDVAPSACAAYEAAMESTFTALGAIPKDRIFSIYLSDGTLPIGASTQDLAKSHRIFPGQGRLDLTKLLKAIIADGGYHGYLTLDTVNEEYRIAPPQSIALDGRRSILYLLSHVYDPYHIGNEVARSTSEDIVLHDHDHVPSPQRQPQQEQHSAVLPPIGTIYGFELVELFLNESKVDVLARWLELIGIKRLGKHRFKNIFWHGNGEVNILLNFDPAIYGKALNPNHAISTTIVGIRVSNAASLLARARCLDYPVVTVHREIITERDFSAVVAPDGNYLIFMENSHWKEDFIIEESQAGTCGDYYSGVKLTETGYSFIDHLAQAFDRPTVEAVTMFYKTLLGMYSKELWGGSENNYGIFSGSAMISCRTTLPREDDPCVIKGGLRFPFGAFDNKETKIGKLVHMAGGSILHHLAFATDDIFTLSEAIRKKYPNTHTLIRIPSQYYDELRCKYQDLTDDFITRIKLNDILYDRIGDTEFLMLHTDLFEEHFFVEICERRNGYEEFGSVVRELREVVHYQQNLASERIKSVQEDIDVNWREKKRRKLHSSVAETESRKTLVVVVVHGEGLVPSFDQTADILGCEYVVVQTWEELCDVERRVRNPVVIGVKKQTFLDHFIERWEVLGSPISPGSGRRAEGSGLKRVLINTVCMEKPNAGDAQMGDICDFEFYYTDKKYNRKEYNRLLSFVLQLKSPHPHDELVAKPRSMALMLPMSDVRSAIDSMDILTVGVDVVELRVDLLQEPGGKGNIPSIKYVGEQIMWLRQSTNLPIVFTVRSVLEGGKFPLEDPEIVHKYLRKALQWGCEYIDVEILRLPKHIKSQLYSRRGMTRIISSYCTTLGTKLNWSSSNLLQIYQAGRLYGDVVRLLGFADDMSDNLELEQFRSTVAKSYDPLIPLTAINMGVAGQLSRLLNSFMTPVSHSLITSLSPVGQITVSEVNAALKIMGQLPTREFIGVKLSEPPAPHIPSPPTSVSRTSRSVRVTADNSYEPTFGPSMNSSMNNPNVDTPLTSVSLFISKCMTELNLPYTIRLDFISQHEIDNTVKTMLRYPLFGGASFPLPIAIPSYLTFVTPAAREIGAIDIILEKRSGPKNTFIGDNITYQGILKVLLNEFSVEAYRDKPALILATSEKDAAPSVYALRSLNVSKIYTVGFGRRGRGSGTGILGALSGGVKTEYVDSLEEHAKELQPFVVISILPAESARIAVPVLERIAVACKAQKLSRTIAGRVYIELITNFPLALPSASSTAVEDKRGGWSVKGTGVAQEAMKYGWGFAYPAGDVQLQIVTEKMRAMFGQHISYGFMRMAAMKGLY